MSLDPGLMAAQTTTSICGNKRWSTASNSLLALHTLDASLSDAGHKSLHIRTYAGGEGKSMAS
jgi:hypothetical protein